MHRESTGLDLFVPSYEHMEISQVLYTYILMVVPHRFYEFVFRNTNFGKILCWLKEGLMYTNFKYEVSVIHQARLFPEFSRLLFTLSLRS